MTVPTRPVRRADRERRFDLRATALFFLFLAVLLCALAFLVRTLTRTAGQRPVWALSLLLVTAATVWLCRSRRRRRAAAGYARRATLALEEAAERASDSLGELGTPERTVEYAAVPAPAVGTVRLGEAPEEYVELDPDDFEHAVAGLCARDECRSVEVVGGAGDLGADVIAVTSDGRRVVVQCKRYGDGHRVGSQDLQRFGGTCFTVHEADVAVLVTTSDFTAPALEYARQCGIVCVDGEALTAWHDRTGPAPWALTG
ncbi:restriction endonuclease [Streptomyces griseoviridis]|jgi:restriction system protein|uniref:Restriction endonuclease n=1 Tax=Streptomyces griseoviridis TaxID=45398 RepID=A0A918GI89_STRGD|nr:restriction endonuclease [Streptomyces niveoruber]GGS40223.1 restriction endonuclease [Streptomyces niveoruber]